MSLEGSSVEVCDPDLFDRLYQDYGPRLQRCIRSFVGSDHLVDDVVQETFIRYYQSGYHDFTDRDPWPWLLTVSRRVAIDMHRRRTVRRERSSDHEKLERSSIEVSKLFGSPESTVIPTGQAMQVAEALRLLDPRHRRILLRKHVHGFKYSEIADAEGMSLDALKSALARARRSFKESYLAVVRDRGFEGVFGPLLFPLARRLRGLRDRLAGSPWVQSMANAPVSMSAAVDSLAAAAVVLGAVAVGGAVAGASPATSATPAAAVEEVPTVSNAGGDYWSRSAVLEPGGDGDDVSGPDEVAPADGAAGTVSADDSLGHSAGTGGGVSGDGGESGPDVFVDSGGVIPVANPPAEGSSSSNTGDHGLETLQEVSVDKDLDGERDGGAGSAVDVDCNPSPRQGEVTKTACVVITTADSTSDPENDPLETLDEPFPGSTLG